MANVSLSHISCKRNIKCMIVTGLFFRHAFDDEMNRPQPASYITKDHATAYRISKDDSRNINLIFIDMDLLRSERERNCFLTF